MYLVFTRMPGESCRRRLKQMSSCSCDVYPAISSSLTSVLILHRRSRPRSVSGEFLIEPNGFNRSNPLTAGQFT